VKVNREYPSWLSFVDSVPERTRFTPAVNGRILSLYQDRGYPSRRLLHRFGCFDAEQV